MPEFKAGKRERQRSSCVFVYIYLIRKEMFPKSFSAAPPLAKLGSLSLRILPYLPVSE
jgi:hypothetical protein